MSIWTRICSVTCKFFNKELLMLRKILSIIIVSLAVLAPVMADGISVTGQAEVSVQPDVAYVTITSSFTEDSMSSARDKVAQEISQVVTDLETLYGISIEDISTSYISSNTVTRWDSDSESYITIGYRAEQVLNVTVRDISILGDVYDNFMGRDGISMSSPTLDKEDKTDVYRETRTLAVKDARAKADTYAEAAGVKVKSVISISDTSGYQPVYGRSNMLMAASAAVADSGVSTEYYLGDITVRSSVSMVFSIEDPNVQTLTAVQL